MSSNNDPLASAAKGAAEGVLSWTYDIVKDLARKFKERSLAFIEDVETIDLAKEQRTTGEWDFFKKYVKDINFRILFQMGLTLRKLDKEKKDLIFLQTKILKKYDQNGLRVVHFVQNGLFSKYIGNILERAITPQKLTFEIETLFRDINKAVVFIQTKDGDRINQKADEIIAKILANSPETFIISSSKSAMGTCEIITSRVRSEISGYTLENYSADGKKIYFLNREEESFEK